jgi:hypothetical protein
MIEERIYSRCPFCKGTGLLTRIRINLDSIPDYVCDRDGVIYGYLNRELKTIHGIIKGDNTTKIELGYDDIVKLPIMEKIDDLK